MVSPENSLSSPSRMETVYVGDAVVVAEKNLGLIGERTDDRDLDAAGLERQNAVVLEQNHRFVGDLMGELAIRRAVQLVLIDL